MRQILRLFVIAAVLTLASCDNGLEPPALSQISVAEDEYAFATTGNVIDRKLNEDNSYQTDIRLGFNDESYILFTLNSENDRSFNTAGYVWSAEEENGNISAATIFLSENNEQYSLLVNTFSIETNNENFIISFDLSGDFPVSGTFNGILDFQERYVSGSGSFEVEGVVYDVPYFGLSEIIENTDGLYLARLYFYSVDPTNPFLREERSHSLYITIVQAAPEALQAGTYTITEAIRPFTLFDGKPLTGPNYQFEGGSATFSQVENSFDVSFTLSVSEGGVQKAVTGSYTGALNGW